MSNHPSKKRDKVILKSIGSIVLAIIASSHHWLHTLLIALGLTTLGAGLFAIPPAYKAVFLLISLTFSIWFLIVSKRKWNRNRPVAFVYLISSLISIVLVLTAIPETITSLNQSEQQDQQKQSEQQQHDHNTHSDL